MRSTLLISLHPRHAQNILSGRKTIELRRTTPRHTQHTLLNPGVFLPGFDRILIYETRPTMSIVGFCTPTTIRQYSSVEWHNYKNQLCLSIEEIEEYLGGYCGWGIKVKNPQSITPITLVKMRELNITPPQGYRYLSDELVEQLLA